MKLYGKKFLKQRMREPAQNTIETRDSVVWDVNVPARYCRVKIQGSNELIVAYFPQGWQQTPSWLKEGISAKINHMGGVRGRIEVIGPGQFVPTPVSGGTLPTPATPPDAVTLGGHVGASATPAMSVDVDAATYRIGGVSYSSSATTVSIDAAPAVGQYRYDIIYADTAGTVHVAKGTAAASDPVMPSIPANTVQLGYVLVYGGMTSVTSTWTNRGYSDPVPGSVTVEPTDDDLAWGEMSTVVTVSVFDQYGNPYSEAAPGIYLTLEFQEMGNGTLHSDEEGDSTTKIGAHAGAGSNHYHFTYTRNGLATDQSVTLKGTNETTRTRSGYATILLRDENGNVMAGDATPSMYEDFDLTLFPEYAGAVMTASGSNNDPGTFGMTSDFEAVSDSLYNYYQWKSSIASGLQSYYINVKIPMPLDFVRFRTGVNMALTLAIKTEENTITNNKISVTLKKDGSATTSSLTDQKSSSAATWQTIGFDETDTVLASLVAGDVLNVTIELYSQNSKYARVGKINLQVLANPAVS